MRNAKIKFSYFDIDDFCSLDKIEKIFKSDVDELKQYSKNTRNTVYTCKDGDGIIIMDNKIHFYGDIKVIKEGEISKT